MASDLIRLSALLDDAKCFDLIRHIAGRMACGARPATATTWSGTAGTMPGTRASAGCAGTARRASTISPARCWSVITSSCGSGCCACISWASTWSNRQIAQELDLDEGDVHAMTGQLRQGLVERQPDVRLDGEVEADEVYVVAGHKGNPAAVQKKVARGAGGD
jgi:hypothetical protein